MSNSNYDFVFKIVLIGDSGVGKSNILLRYVSNKFDTSSKATIGAEFQSKFIKTEDDLTISAQIWDTCGQEKYSDISKIYYKNAVGALIVYDITCRESFVNAQNWLKKIRETAVEDIVILLIGNKSDLIHTREIQMSEGSSFAEKNGMGFIETSALDSNNIETAFSILIN